MTTTSQKATDAAGLRSEADWIAIVDEIGPSFAEGAAERDANDVFVADHYPVLKERGLISALVPAELGGG